MNEQKKKKKEERRKGRMARWIWTDRRRCGYMGPLLLNCVYGRLQKPRRSYHKLPFLLGDHASPGPQNPFDKGQIPR